MIDPERLTAIGTLGKPNGYKGDIVLIGDGVEPEVDSFIFLEPDDLPVPWRVTSVRPKGLDYVLHLKGIESDEAASRLTGMSAYMADEDLPEEEDDDTVYLNDLVGFKVFEDGEEIGEITAVDDSTENVLFQIRSTAGKQLLVPAAEDFIDEIDMEHHQLHMDLPAGLIELND